MQFVGRRVKVDPETGCWNWIGAKTDNGYGMVSIDGVAHRAHRLMWAIFNGAIPKGILVCHKCDNPGCVNPEHGFLGTHSDNENDKVAKGRHRSPISPASPKTPRVFNARRKPRVMLTPEQAAAVRASSEPVPALAESLGVSPATIYALRSGKTWRHLADEPRAPTTAKSRTSQKGAAHSKAKLSEAIVREIRASQASGIVLAARHGISEATVSKIRKRRLWAHLPD